MKLLILSYRANRYWNDSCNCHPNTQCEYGDVSFLQADSIDAAALQIATRLSAGIHAEHGHVILENFEAGFNARSEIETEGICHKGEKIPYSSKKYEAFIPGKIEWPNKYDQYEEPELHEEENKRILPLCDELFRLIEIEYDIIVFAEKDRQKKEEEKKKQRELEEQRKRDEKQLEYLKNKLSAENK
jgi:hypothetical protein